MKTHPLDWFEARVGQRIYPTYSQFERNAFPIISAKYTQQGIFIRDIAQAYFLWESQTKASTQYSDVKPQNLAV